MPDYREEISSQIPALQLLMSLGFTYLTPQEAMGLRGGSNSNVLLEPILAEWLKANNQVTYKSRTLPFEDSNIQTAVKRLRDEPFDGLFSTNQRLYEDFLASGISLPQTVDGDRRSYTLQYINWKQPQKNIFHVTDEFSVAIPGKRETRRPDIVCFVNGIPLVVIECKRPDLQDGHQKPTDSAIKQFRGYQSGGDSIPNLFVFSQLLLAISSNDAFFATTLTEKKYWMLWREEDKNGNVIEDAVLNRAVAPLINRPLSELEKQHLYDYRHNAANIRREFDQIEAGGGRVPTAQDRAIYCLLRPERLLELVYQFIVFDGNIKKISRYQQYFAIKATIDQVAHLNIQHTRTGGIIWHTTGSGKSLTMVMLAKALALHPNVPNPKVIVVTDRINLDDQIWNTFNSCGKHVVKAKNGHDLVQYLKHPKADVITTVINKFETAVRRQVVNDNINIFVLVDESHRSQYGEFHTQMRRVLPNACYIGFTGTPLMKKDKRTADKFGGFIHQYPMRRAVDDEAVVPLLYEGRIVEMDVNQRQIDRWFDRITYELTEDQKGDLKRKFSSKEMLSHAEQRIREIAFDISEHYRQHWQGTGFKAQLATPKKSVALLYKRFLDEWGDVESAVLISSPDMREGDDEEDDINDLSLHSFWKRMKAQYKSEANYNKSIKSSFSREDGIEILIVVDKLLTGFDEPRNRILYIDKPLKEHNLLQAIARVNRLFDGKENGLIIDYRGVLGELNKAMNTYNALEGFDADDVAGTLNDIAEQIDKLPHYYAILWDIFKTVANKHDKTQLEEQLRPEDVRQHFYEALANFTRTLHLALSTVSFYESTSMETIAQYKRDLKLFRSIKITVGKRFAETINYKEYEPQIHKLIDDHVQAQGVVQLTLQVDIFDTEAFDAEVARVNGVAAKADTIAYRMKRTISENMDKDPGFYRPFSKMIEDALADYKAGRIEELELLERMQKYLGEIREGKRRDEPEKLARYKDAGAYFRRIKERFEPYMIEQDVIADFAIQAEEIVENHKVRDWVNDSDITNLIRNDLEDYLYTRGFDLEWGDIDEIMNEIISVAKNRN